MTAFTLPPAAVPSPGRPAVALPPAAEPRFGPLEWAYAAVVLQTILYNPVIAENGDLQVYANTITWPLLALGAVVRWLVVGDRPLHQAMTSLLIGGGVTVWLIVLQGAVTGFDRYAAGHLLRLMFVPIGIVTALAVYRSIHRLLDLTVVALGVKGVFLVLGMLGGPIQLANRLFVPELGGHNTFGSFLVFLVILRASTWIFGGRRPGRLVLASLLVMLACVFLTFSRGAFVTLVGGLLLMIVLALRERRWRGRALKAAFLLLLALAPLLVSGPLQSRLTALSLTQSSGRDEVWRPAWDGFVANPIGGSGFGSFEVYSRFLEDPFSLDAPITYSAHNLPLQILYEGGIVGLLAVALATALLLRTCWSPVILPCAAAIFVDSLFETFPYVVQVSWVLGLVFAVGLRHRVDALRERPADVPAVALTKDRP